MKSDWDPEHLIANIRETTQNSQDIAYFVDRQLTRIAELTRHTSLNLKQAIQLISSMGVYGTWLAMRGLVDISDGSVNGWNYIHGSFLFRAWGTRFAIAQLYASKNGQRLLRDDVTECLAHAIAIGDDSFADFFGNCLINSFNVHDGRFLHHHKTPYEPFIITLYSIWRNIRFSAPDSQEWDLGPYKEIVRSWDNLPNLNTAIESACDYHCDENGYLGYANVPYFLFPVEILAIERVRISLGLTNFTTEHPLLKSQYATPTGTSFEHELLAKAVDVLSATYPQCFTN